MDNLLRHPVIAAVRDVKQMHKAVKSPVDIIFLMTGDLLSVERCVQEARASDKRIFLHIDLIKGLSNDKEAVKYMAVRLKPDGIVSTKGHLLQAAKQEGLYAVHHLFLIDTHAFQQGIRNVQELKPDAVEVMPGLMTRIITELKGCVPCPIIAAGLVKHQEEVCDALAAGASSVAIGDAALWNYTPNIRP